MNKADFDDADLEFDSSLVRQAVDTVLFNDDTDRQLSSDLDALRFSQYPVDHITPRGPTDDGATKKETRDHCMYQGQGQNNHGIYMPQQQQHIHGEMHAGYIKPASFDPWSQPHSVETDNALSMMSVLQPSPQIPYKPIEVGSFPPKGHQQSGYYDNPDWPNKEQMLPDCRPETFGTVNEEDVVAMETEMNGGSVSYQLDEIGECALHTLSLVTDKTIMAKVLEAVQSSSSLQEMLNLQNKLKQTPLFLAVQAFNVPLIGWLLQNGADPNIQGIIQTGRHDYLWRAPLHLVAMMGDRAVSILHMMRSKYPNLNLNILSTGDKLTPLHIALKTHSTENSCSILVNELVRNGADVGIREQASSKTPLILAIETRDLKLIREYLEMFSAERRRALLQDKTRAGDTCLHIAAGLSRFPSELKVVLLRMLVMNGANGNTANNAKELPRDFARTEWDSIRS